MPSALVAATRLPPASRNAVTMASRSVSSTGRSELRGTTYHRESTNFLVNTLIHNLTWKARKTLPGEGAPAAPAAPGAPEAVPTPPVGDPAAPAVAKKVDPITDAVTHVFLFGYQPDGDPRPGVFKFFTQSLLPPLVSSAAAVGPGIGGPPMGDGIPGMGGGGDRRPRGCRPVTPVEAILQEVSERRLAAAASRTGYRGDPWRARVQRRVGRGIENRGGDMTLQSDGDRPEWFARSRFFEEEQTQ